jgi:hypothetical protein
MLRGSNGRKIGITLVSMKQDWSTVFATGA